MYEDKELLQVYHCFLGESYEAAVTWHGKDGYAVEMFNDGVHAHVSKMRAAFDHVCKSLAGVL